MAPKNPVKKRVRIKSGHEARYIPYRKSMKKYKSKKGRRSTRPKKARHSSRPKKAVCCYKMGSSQTHRPTVPELVYQYLEKDSNRITCKNQKTNATYQFRKEHRNKRLRPNARRHSTRIEDPRLYHRLGQAQLGDMGVENRNKSKETVFEILSLGAMLGYLTPTDKSGTSFRVNRNYDVVHHDDDTVMLKKPAFYESDRP